MIEKEKEVSGKYQFNLYWLMYVPLVLLVGVIPLIVQLVKVDVQEEYILFITGNNIDLFTQAKSTLIYCAIGLIAISLFISFDKRAIKRGLQSNIYYISSGVFVVMTLLSMWLSQHPHTAMWGLPNRSEGGVMIVCYIVMMIYAYWTIKEQKAIKFILIPLAVVVVISTVLGYFQYIGEDLFMTTDFGKALIIPEYYAEDRQNLSALYAEGNIYGTMGHYNYVGSFSAMVVPLFLTLTLYIKNYKVKIVSAVLTGCSIFLMFGSTARSALIGLIFSSIVFLLIFARTFLRQWKVIVVLVVIVGTSLFGLDRMTEGAVFDRIPMLFEDVIELLEPVDENFDYKANLPIQDIEVVDGEVIIQGKSNLLRVVSDGDKLSFYNQDGEEQIFIFFDMGEGQTRYFIQEGVYQPYRFDISTYEGRKYAQFYWNEQYIIDIDITDQELVLAERFDKSPLVLEEPEAIGFRGKEQIGSARGYIWSRSLPMLKDTLLVGLGPDAFAFEFPQYDVFGKWYAYGTPNMIVDKPHNLYLQIAINQGVVALIAFLVLVGSYIVQSFSLYGFRKGYSNLEITAIAIMLAVVGYLGAGVFNDSVVAVAPIFFVLLGTGMALNMIADKQQIKIQKQRPHATVDMKTRKHIQ